MYGYESWTIKKAEHQRTVVNCSVGENSWESLGLQGDPVILKEISPNIHWKDWCWSWNSNTLTTWCEELTHLKSPWLWQRLKKREVDDRGWGGWMASLTQWTWVWVSSGSWCWTGKPGMLQSMGSQRVGHWETEWKFVVLFIYLFLDINLFILIGD